MPLNTSSAGEFIYFWFRRDLRIHDNAGLAAALKSGLPVKPVFIFDRNILSRLEPDDRRVSFIYHALQHMAEELRNAGSDLWVYHGDPVSIWKDLLNSPGCAGIYTNRDYEPYARERDAKVSKMAETAGYRFMDFKDQVMFERSEVVKDDGLPYTVYTPYSKRWKSLFRPEMEASAESEKLLGHCFKGKAHQMPSLGDLGFTEQDSATPATTLNPMVVKNYARDRDLPALPGTSRMSVHLRFGTVSIRQLVRESRTISEKYLNELIWRDFYQQILWHFPHVATKAFKPRYDHIEWRNNPDEFKRWCDGQTGYPLVDAGMRELLATGFMHNRVRMVVASFLTKHLLIDWRWGEAWFARHLLDFDLASNNGGWQWAAGSGVDAAPYFRVFNPTLQTLKFDPDFRYIRKWIPEFDTLRYPRPMVDHDMARKRCLETYQKAVGPMQP